MSLLLVRVCVFVRIHFFLRPPLCSMSSAGCGVRIKYGLIKVYAVGSYFDPLAMSAVKTASSEAIQQALLDPTYPRTIRIVMNRGLAIDKYTAAIVEALEPRMKGQDTETLEEFKKLNPPVDLVQGAELEMTIRGDTMLYKNAMGGVGTIRSRVFTEAMCDVFYGADAVSPTMKEAVQNGVPKL
jgi:Chalcone isomerase-like